MAEKRPFRIVLGEGPQKGALGGSLSRYVPPGAQYDYNPPSVFERYKVLSILFALLIMALLAFLIIAPRHDPHRVRVPAAPANPSPPERSADPVYVTPLSIQPRP